MKKVKVFLAIMCMAMFTILNVSALFTEAEAKVAPKFSGGDWIYNEDGEKIGCSCPVNYGDCLCRTTPQT